MITENFFGTKISRSTLSIVLYVNWTQLGTIVKCYQTIVIWTKKYELRAGLQQIGGVDRSFLYLFQNKQVVGIIKKALLVTIKHYLAQAVGLLVIAKVWLLQQETFEKLSTWILLLSFVAERFNLSHHRYVTIALSVLAKLATGFMTHVTMH